MYNIWREYRLDFRLQEVPLETFRFDYQYVFDYEYDFLETFRLNSKYEFDNEYDFFETFRFDYEYDLLTLVLVMLTTRSSAEFL